MSDYTRRITAAIAEWEERDPEAAGHFVEAMYHLVMASPWLDDEGKANLRRIWSIGREGGAA